MAKYQFFMTKWFIVVSVEFSYNITITITSHSEKKKRILKSALELYVK